MEKIIMFTTNATSLLGRRTEGREEGNSGASAKRDRNLTVLLNKKPSPEVMEANNEGSKPVFFVFSSNHLN